MALGENDGEVVVVGFAEDGFAEDGFAEDGFAEDGCAEDGCAEDGFILGLALLGLLVGLALLLGAADGGGVAASRLRICIPIPRPLKVYNGIEYVPRESDTFVPN